MAGCLPLRFLLEEVVENGPVILEVIIRHGKPARRADLVDINDDDTPRSRNTIHFLRLDKLIETRCSVLNHAAMAKQPHDPRRAFESVQHDSHTVVARLVDVRDGLVAAAGELLVPEGFAVEHAKVLAAFGRDVDVAVA